MGYLRVGGYAPHIQSTCLARRSIASAGVGGPGSAAVWSSRPRLVWRNSSCGPRIRSSHRRSATTIASDRLAAVGSTHPGSSVGAAVWSRGPRVFPAGNHGTPSGRRRWGKLGLGVASRCRLEVGPGAGRGRGRAENGPLEAAAAPEGRRRLRRDRRDD
jgi:hypothetical protein